METRLSISVVYAPKTYSIGYRRLLKYCKFPSCLIAGHGDVHHLDHDTNNNHFLNLVLIDTQTHRDYHSALRSNNLLKEYGINALYLKCSDIDRLEVLFIRDSSDYSKSEISKICEVFEDARRIIGLVFEHILMVKNIQDSMIKKVILNEE